MDRIEAMAVFVTVADLRGFAPAARKLGLSPPAVTRLVAALEEHLQTRLLQRTTRSVSLTDAGARYLERARRILADIEEAESAARVEREGPAGRLVVAAPQMFGRLHVAPLLSDYLATYPRVVAELRLSDANVSLVEEGVDVAVRIGRLADSGLSARKVGETQRVVVASPEYLRRRGTPRTPEDLASHAVIQFTGVSATPEWRFFRRGELVRQPLSPAFLTNALDAGITHAAAGGGLAWVLMYQVAERVRSGSLVVVLRDFEGPASPIHVVYPSARFLPAKVRVLAEMAAARGWKFV
ncbi:MAG: LysR family transcriptional regulator [Polyangiaceae bacterium]